MYESAVVQENCYDVWKFHKFTIFFAQVQISSIQVFSNLKQIFVENFDFILTYGGMGFHESSRSWDISQFTRRKALHTIRRARTAHFR